MTDICDEEIDDFLLTFAEAMAIHAFGDNLGAVRVEKFPAMAYVVLISNLDDEIQFDYLDYFIRVGDIFGEKIKLDLIDLLLKYMSENGHV